MHSAVSHDRRHNLPDIQALFQDALDAAMRFTASADRTNDSLYQTLEKVYALHRAGQAFADEFLAFAGRRIKITKATRRNPLMVAVRLVFGDDPANRSNNSRYAQALSQIERCLGGSFEPGAVVGEIARQGSLDVIVKAARRHRRQQPDEPGPADRLSLAETVLAPAMARPLASFQAAGATGPGYGLALVHIDGTGRGRLLRLVPNSAPAAERFLRRLTGRQSPPAAPAPAAPRPASAGLIALSRAARLRRAVPANHADHRMMVLRNGPDACRVHLFTAAADGAPPFFAQATLPALTFLPAGPPLVLAENQARLIEALPPAEDFEIETRWLDEIPAPQDIAFAPACLLRFGAKGRVYLHQPSGRTPPPRDVIEPGWGWEFGLTPGQQEEIVELARARSGLWNLACDGERWVMRDRHDTTRLSGKATLLRFPAGEPFRARALVLAHALEALRDVVGRTPMRLRGCGTLLEIALSEGGFRLLVPAFDGSTYQAAHAIETSWADLMA